MACVRTPRVRCSAKASHTPFLPHLFPCLTPVCGLIPGIAFVVRMTELSKPEEDLQDPGEAQGPEEVQLLGAEVGEAASASASSPAVSCSALPQEALNEMVANLMKFLLLNYRAKEMTSQAEMLKKVLRDNQEHFSVLFSQASECLQLVCGAEMKEVDPREHIYIMVPTLGLTCDAMLSSGQSMPKASLLVLVLSLKRRSGEHSANEDVCQEGALCFGEPRELLTQVWVQEGYLKYWQMSDNDPACFEFLCGRQACTETSK